MPRREIHSNFCNSMPFCGTTDLWSSRCNILWDAPRDNKKKEVTVYEFVYK